MDHNPPTTHPTAGDVMTASVVSIAPEKSVSDVARLLLDARISAVPVVDGTGALLGIVSEGDLLGRSAEDRLAGQEWWLAILSAPGQMEAAVKAAATVRRVQDVMHAPVLTVEATTPVRDVAELLRINAIKRVPVMRDGRMVGIVSRADLLRAMETIPVGETAPASGGFAEMIASFFGGTGTNRPARPSVPPALAPALAPALTPALTTTSPKAAAPAPKPITADGFRQLVEASEQGKLDEQRTIAHAAELERIQQVKTMLHDHLGAEMWDTLMAHAQVAAAHGGKELELLRFPSELCSDGGRKINNVDPAWAETLQGEAAELQSRWARDLKPQGFGLVARVIDYPKGMPGTIAMVLVWDH